MLRTHTCGELRREHVGKEVTLCGWVDSYRDHGGGLFVDLRDRYGKTQIVFNPPDTSLPIIDESKSLRTEYVIQVTGKVAPRPRARRIRSWRPARSKSASRVQAAQQEPHAARFADANAQDLPGEDLRLKYRYLDLRRPEMQQTLVLRDRIIKGHARLLREHEFHRRRNADPRPQHAGRCPRLSRAEPRAYRDRSTPCRSRRSSTSRS